MSPSPGIRDPGRIRRNGARPSLDGIRYFLPALTAAGALEKWKTEPIGGEIRPELWPTMFTDRHHQHGQDFAQCVQQTHATWLMDTGMFRKQPSKARRQRAIEAVRQMGYDFQVVTADIQPVAGRDQAAVDVTLRNNGVAPFYDDWRVELAALNAAGAVVKRWPTDWSITRLLPGDADRTWSASVSTAGVGAGLHQLAVRVVNPMPGGLPLQFANADQDRHAAGWLTLGELRSP